MVPISSQPTMQECKNGYKKRAPRQGMLDNPGMVNVYQMGSLQTHLTANAYAKAQGEFQAALDAERAAKAAATAQLSVAVAEASACKQQLALQTQRAAAAEAAAEMAAAREAAAVGRVSKLEDELRKPRAARAAEMEQLKAVHKATFFQQVEKEVKARRKDDEQARKAEAKQAKQALEAAHKLGQQHRQEQERMGELVRLATEAALAESASLSKSVGHYKAQVARLHAAEKRRLERESPGTARQREVARVQELEDARINDEQLRAEAERLRATVVELDGCQPRARPSAGALNEDAAAAAPTAPTTLKLIAPRTARGSEAPLTARTCEHLRRLCEEAGLSFRGASTAIALVLSLFIEGGATEEMLISSVAIKQAFERLGMIDDDRERTINMASKLYWAIGADGGNKGRAIERIAYCVWCEKLGKPVARPLSASDLFANQTAANGERTLIAAVDHLGLAARYCSTITTDGTEHAVQESENTMKTLHQREAEHEEQRSAISNCCIHGKALEENAGLEAMWPGERVVGALRLLWEIVGLGEGGRRDEYRESWVVDCKFDGLLYDQTLGSLPEPTSAKWQVGA